MIDQISNSFSEVFAILNCLSEEDKNKIPKSVWNKIINMKNNEYNYEYIPGDEEYLNEYTIAILIHIYFKYFKSDLI